jgi:DNA (cytosine-5)-methyltransferase 1
MNYYNEFDPYAADWLENLISFGCIAPGDVDRRSIVDVQPDDLKGYTQCHFFAGIGGWSQALKLAGWPDERPVWTGSCPCQPFSVAGLGKGTADERHLWPEFARLIAECGPPVVYGEQVASKDGREWLAGVRADLEALGYEVGAADLCAAGAGSPHIRQRLYWLADANSGTGGQKRSNDGGGSAGGCEVERPGLGGGSLFGRVGHADNEGPQGRGVSGHSPGQRPAGEAGLDGAWSRYDVVQCIDGKARRFEPGSFPLAHGVSNRVGRLRAYGNAIVPQVAAEFVGAYMDIA